MRVFLTGATGFIGSFLVPELLAAGHRVTGLTRTDSGALALTGSGAEAIRGDVKDLDLLRATAKGADAVVHAAFNHDVSRLVETSEEDRRVIETLGDAIAGRPFVVTSGTGLVRPKSGGPASETDDHATSAEFPRAASEEAADALIARGGHVMVMRLPQVHDMRRQGRVTRHIQLARQKGRVAYVGEGRNRLPAVHVSDAVRAYRLALEKGKAGARYHAVAEQGVTMRDIAAVIGLGLDVSVDSLTADEAATYFGGLAKLAALDLPASGALTQEWLGWTPTGPTLLSDLRDMDYSAV